MGLPLNQCNHSKSNFHDPHPDRLLRVYVRPAHPTMGLVVAPMTVPATVFQTALVPTLTPTTRTAQIQAVQARMCVWWIPLPGGHTQGRLLARFTFFKNCFAPVLRFEAATNSPASCFSHISSSFALARRATVHHCVPLTSPTSRSPILPTSRLLQTLHTSCRPLSTGSLVW